MVGLFNNIRPHLRKALQTVYLREVSSRQWEIAQEEKPNAGNFIVLAGIQKVRSLWKGGGGGDYGRPQKANENEQEEGVKSICTFTR